MALRERRKGCSAEGNTNERARERGVAVIGDGAQFGRCCGDIMCERFVQFLRSCQVWQSCVFAHLQVCR